MQSFEGLQPDSWPLKGFRSKAMSPDRLSRSATEAAFC